MFRDRARPGAALALTALVGLAGVAGLAGCQAAKPAGAPATVPPVVTTLPVATTTSTTPPTTVFNPGAPQPSQDLAGSHLIAAWKAGDRAAALTDATPAAVDAVFAQAYPAGGLQARGCATPVAGPANCIYRVLANGTALSLSAENGPGGWFVAAARFEGQ
jgi:hypothetical protein